MEGQVRLFRLSPEGRRAFELDVRKSVLASRLSVKPETFLRVIKQLSQDGIISVHGGHFTVVDRDELIALAELADSTELGSGQLPCKDIRFRRS